MSVSAVVGANWGDEGKGKITDLLAQEADFVVRFQGGNNAGHTIINEYGKFQLHLLPSGVFNPNTTNVLATGVAVNIEAFLKEYKELISRSVPEPNIKISHRAQVVLPHHILLDKLEEERLGAKQFGSTKSGMAPFYSDKYLKIGIQVADLFDYDSLLDKVKRNIEKKNILMEYCYKTTKLEAVTITDYLYQLGQEIKRFTCDTRKLLLDNLDKNILMEGQLGALKDPDHGIYPMTTSSSPLASFAPVSTGLPARSLEKVITVVKAYSSCVGAGPFVSEIFGDEADQLRSKGGDDGEYGATTGRPRRMGWFDVVATKYGCELQGTTDVVLSLLDVLGYLDEIPLCVAYKLGKDVIHDFPTFSDLERATPVIETMKGWKCDISHIRKFEDLPQEAQDYTNKIEELIGCPITYISVGSKRDDIIIR
ncbi:adenylosuccinate synthase [Spirochaeta cellobiosiphila]|uniref:adenylosuccinate synthase n=1 Tax=Spirochaeta cellobiosiphila TaxID=504483 RepID=UPI000424C4B1|nr:adenylosuccinate synthase [Spirochaeta cellobiosiphila]